MTYGLKGVFHRGLKWTAQSCLHKNRGSGLNLDNVTAFSILVLNGQNVVEEHQRSESVWSNSFYAIKPQLEVK